MAGYFHLVAAFPEREQQRPVFAADRFLPAMRSPQFLRLSRLRA